MIDKKNIFEFKIWKKQHFADSFWKQNISSNYFKWYGELSSDNDSAAM